MKKRALAWSLSAMLVIGSIPSQSLYARTATSSELTDKNTGVIYVLNEKGGATIKGYDDRDDSSNPTSIIIPENVSADDINYYQVTDIAEGAFTDSEYDSMGKITVLADDLTIAAGSGLGKTSGNVNVTELVFWGNENGKAKEYAESISATYKIMATGIGAIASARDLKAVCYSGTDFRVYVDMISKSQSCDDNITWSSENDEEVSITEFNEVREAVDNEDGTYTHRKSATVNIKDAGDGVCKIYAQSASTGEKKEVELSLQQSADRIEIEEVKIYEEVKDTSEEAQAGATVWQEATDLADTYFINNTITADVGRKVRIKAKAITSGVTSDNLSATGTEAGEFFKIDYEKENDTTYITLDLLKITPTTKDVIITTKSGKSQTVKVSITKKATDMDVVDSSNKSVLGGILLMEGSSSKLKAKFTPSDSTDTVTWTSSDPNTATVSPDGTVNALRRGAEITITCAINDTKGSKRSIKKVITLIVYERVLYKTLYISDELGGQKIDSLDIEKGSKKTLFPVGTADDANDTPNEPLSYTSSNVKIATVDKEGIVTAVSPGTATISVAADRAGTETILATVTVNVYERVTSVSIANMDIPAGQTRDITYTVSPATATENVKWISTDESKVKVEDLGDKKIRVTTFESALTEGQESVTVNIVAQGAETGQELRSVSVNVLKPIHMTDLGIKISNVQSYVHSYIDVDGIRVYQVEKGQKVVLEPDYRPIDANDTLTWLEDSSNGNTVKAQKISATLEVTADNIGIACFTLKDDCIEKQMRCKIEVIVPATSVEIKTTNNTSPDSICVGVGENSSINLKATLEGKSATDKIVWSYDESMLKIDGPSGKETIKIDGAGVVTDKEDYITVTGLKIGETKLKATTYTCINGECMNAVVSDEITIIVNNPSTEINVKDGAETVKEIIIMKNGNKTVSLDVLPVDTTDSIFSWSSKNKLVTIEPSEDTKSAKITAGGTTGKDEITIIGNASNSASTILNVVIAEPTEKIETLATESTVYVGDKGTITTTQTPATATDGVKFSVDKEGILEIKQNNTKSGVTKFDYTAKAVGDVKITFTTGSGKTVEVVVHVVSINIADASISSISSQNYTGSEIKVTPTVKVGSATLVEGTDYDVTYENNINAGQAKFIATGKGNYTGTATKVFSINAIDKSKITKTFSETGNGETLLKTFDGTVVKPAILLKWNEYTLVEGQDYDVVYKEESMNVGRYNISITYKGNFKNTDTMYYNIVAKDISTSKDIVVSGINSSGYTYNSEYIKPAIVVKDGKNVLKNNDDYTLSYSNNKNASTKTLMAKIVIKAKGNYTGTKEVSFKINPLNISKAKVSGIENKVYSGSEITPSLTVKYGNMSVSYETSFKNNKNTGKATVTIKGIGNFTGYKSITFNILPKEVSGVTQYKASTTSVALKWAKSAGKVTGYRVYQVIGKKYKKVAETTKNYATIKKLKAGKQYKYVVCAYNKSSGNGKYSSVLNAVTASSAPTKLKLSSKTSKSVNVSWKASAGAGKYYVYTSANGKKYKKATETSGTSCAISNLKGGKKIYVKVKAVRTANGKEFLSSYSKVSSIKVKK